MAIDIEAYGKWCDRLKDEAKDICEEHYEGDDYYEQECWQEYFQDGYTARNAVLSDMSHWDG